MNNNQQPMDCLLNKIQSEYEEIVVDWHEWLNATDKQEALSMLIAHGYVKVDDTKPLTESMETYVLAGYIAEPIRNYEYSKLKSDGKGGYTALLCELNTNIFIVARGFILGDYTWDVDKSEYFYDKELAIKAYDNASVRGL